MPFRIKLFEIDEKKFEKNIENMESNIWGIVLSIVGLILLICGSTKSNFFISRLFVARSKILWKSEEKVHKFYQIVGVLIIVFGVLVAFEIIKK